MYNITLGSTVDSTINNIKNKNKYANVKIYNSSSKSKTSGSLATGDKVEVASGTSKKTYTVVIYGDVDGSGVINARDLLVLQRYLLNKTELSQIQVKASITDKKAQAPNASDLLKIQRHILGKYTIEQ